jgi:hypothetical protein
MPKYRNNILFKWQNISFCFDLSLQGRIKDEPSQLYKITQHFINNLEILVNLEKAGFCGTLYCIFYKKKPWAASVFRAESTFRALLRSDQSHLWFQDSPDQRPETGKQSCMSCKMHTPPPPHPPQPDFHGVAENQEIWEGGEC